MKILFVLQLLVISFFGAAQNNKQVLLTTIHGNVVSNNTKKPLRNVSVILLKNGTEFKRVTTDTKGHFKFGKLDAATYDLKFEAPGYETEIRKKIILATNRKLRISKQLKASK